MGWEPITYCRECGDAFDVYRAPEERVCECCAELLPQAEAEGRERLPKPFTPTQQDWEEAAQAFHELEAARLKRMHNEPR